MLGRFRSRPLGSTSTQMLPHANDERPQSFKTVQPSVTQRGFCSAFIAASAVERTGTANRVHDSP
jgi:hypothetical protein